METITFDCPFCGKPLTASIAAAGKRGTCKWCNNSVVAPKPFVADEEVGSPLGSVSVQASDLPEIPAEVLEKARQRKMGMRVLYGFGALICFFFLRSVFAGSGGEEKVQVNSAPALPPPAAPLLVPTPVTNERAAFTPVADTAAVPANPGAVFITNSGAKYHRESCRYLQKSKIESTLEAAVARGYTPCKVCSPPVPPGFVDRPQVTYEPQYQRPPPSYNSGFAPAAPTQDATVYVTNTGSKYHRAGCRYLSKSQIPISLSQARGRYGACSVCRP